MISTTKFIFIFFGSVLFFASSGFGWIWKEHTKTDMAEHTFAGNIKCRDGSKILPQATLRIMEYDAGEDDQILIIPLHRGKENPYKTWWESAVYVYEEFDWIWNDGAEVYYQFLHVCFEGQQVEIAPEIDGNKDKEYII